MYAIIETGGKQYWVTPGETIKVDKINAPVGEKITIDAMWSASDKPAEGPVTKRPSAKVVLEILRQLKAPKIIVFKKRIKKAYEKTQGHRQQLTEVQIKEIQLS